MRREWTIWLGFTAIVLAAVVFVLSRADDDKGNRSQLSAGTSLPTSTTVTPTTATTVPPTTTTSSSSTSTTPSTVPTTTRATVATTLPATTTPPTEPATTAPPVTEPPLRIQFGSGTYRVGIDLPAGTYHTEGIGQDCFWARLSSFSGMADSVIVGDHTGGAPATVAVEQTDAGFTTGGCALWLSV